MKTVRYTADTLKDMKRHVTVAARIQKAMLDHAADQTAHANNVTQLVGSGRT